jgi:phage baseplate assembly protein W
MAAPVDFGTEVSCISDFAADGRTVTGNAVVGEAIARRLSTPRGRLIDDPNYGFDLTAYVFDDMTARDIAALCAGATAEALKDERVQDAAVQAVLAKGLLTVTVSITTALGPFRLVLAVTAVSFAVLSVT